MEPIGKYYNMDIQKMSKTELQSLAYEQLVLAEQAKRNLEIISQELQKRAQVPEVKPVEEKKETNIPSTEGQLPLL